MLGRAVRGEGRLEHDLDVSRRHAIIWRDASDDFQIEDLGSVNGTWVNGRRLEGREPLRAGDVVQVGATVLRLAGPLGTASGVATLPSETSAPTAADAATVGDGHMIAAAPAPAPAPAQVTAAAGVTAPDHPPPAPGDVTAPDHPPPPPAGEQLELIAGIGVGRRIRLGQELVLGRGVEGEGRLRDDLDVSRRHARIVRTADGGLQVEDLGSANGTWLNGRRVERAARLAPGDRLTFGQTMFALTDARGDLPEGRRQRP